MTAETIRTPTESRVPEPAAPPSAETANDDPAAAAAKKLEARLRIDCRTRAVRRLAGDEEGGTGLYSPRTDTELYGSLDRDERPIVDYRRHREGAAFDPTFWRIVREDGALSTFVLRLGAWLILVAGLGALYSYMGGIQVDGNWAAVLVVTYVFALPPWAVALVVAGGAVVVFNRTVTHVYERLYANVLIADGHKAVYECWYPVSQLSDRHDRKPDGGYVMALERCCQDERCDHPLGKVYERHMEERHRPATDTGINAAARKFEIIDRIWLAGAGMPSVPAPETNVFAEIGPWGIAALVMGGAAVFLFMI